MITLTKLDKKNLDEVARLSIVPGSLNIHFYETDGGSRTFVGLDAKLSSGQKFPQVLVLVRRKFRPLVEKSNLEFISQGLLYVEQVYDYFQSLFPVDNSPVTVTPPREHFFTLFRESMTSEQ